MLCKPNKETSILLNSILYTSQAHKCAHTQSHTCTHVPANKNTSTVVTFEEAL